MSLEAMFILIAFVVQCIGLGIIMTKIEDIQTMLLKMQANELERLIAEQDRLIAGRTKELGDK